MNQSLLSSPRATCTKRNLSRWSQQLQTIPLCIGLLTIALTHPAIAQEKLLRTLTVTGQGVEMIPTTLARVELGVEIQGKTATEVQQDVARRSTAVVELLRSRNVEKLETTGIQLNPVYSYENNVQRLTGYSASNTVSFRVPNEQAGKLLDDAVQAGATRINSVSFTASDNAISATQKQALQKATQDAQSQADAVLSVLNLTRKEIVNIEVNGATPPPPLPAFTGKDVIESRLASTPIIGGEQRVQASVTLQISY